MPARKRAASEMEVEEHVETPSTLQKLRNMWQFANLTQYISLFGDAVKIDKDFDIEVCLLRARRSRGCAERDFDGTRTDRDAGAGVRVLEAWPVREACADWAGPVEACVVTQGSNVCCP